MAHKHEVDPSAVALDVDDNDNYDSAEDSDFQLDDEAGVVGDDSGLSSSEEEAEADEGGRPAKKRKLNKQQASKKRKGRRDGDDDMELDSGDEATISKAKTKRKKKKTADDEDDEEDVDVILSDNEEGGFVKTRSMRMKMVEEQRPLARIDGATIDVDDLWAKMNAPDTGSGLFQSQKPSTEEPEDHQQPADQEKENISDGEAKTQGKMPSEDMIKIKRTYKFAGEIHTEEKMVPRDSAEAKLYLAETTGEKAAHDSADGSQTETVVITLRRPLRKVSRFDPNPTGIIRKSWEKQPARAISRDTEDPKGPKINTVEKSRLDWAQYVDEAGIKDELNVHSKAKEGYLGRMDFLGRVDAKREEERRNIRLKGL